MKKKTVIVTDIWQKPVRNSTFSYDYLTAVLIVLYAAGTRKSQFSDSSAIDRTAEIPMRARG